MKRLKAKLILFVLVLFTLYLFLLIGEKLHLYQFLYSLFQSLKPFLVALVLVFFVQPLIHRFPFFSYKIKTSMIYGLIGLSTCIVIMLLSFYIYWERDSILQFSNQLFQDGIDFIEIYQFEEMINLSQTKQFITDSTKWLMNSITGVVGGISVFFFGFMIAFFISMEMEVMMNEFKKYVKNHEKWRLFYLIFSDVFLKYCYSTILDMIYLVVVTSFILYFFHTPSFFLLSVSLAVLNLFPYIGAIVGTLIIVGVHMLSGQDHLILLICILILSSQIESNLIHPLIYHKTMKVHPLFLFLSILINDFLFGLIGVILSPILAVFLQMGVKSYLDALNQNGVGGWEDLK